jgi:hypothetical protein
MVKSVSAINSAEDPAKMTWIPSGKRISMVSADVGLIRVGSPICTGINPDTLPGRGFRGLDMRICGLTLFRRIGLKR